MEEYARELVEKRVRKDQTRFRSRYAWSPRRRASSEQRLSKDLKKSADFDRSANDLTLERSSTNSLSISETAVSADEVINALRRYVEKTGDTQRAAAVKMGVNRHTLCRWLTEKQIPKKIDLVLVAVFLKRARFL